MFLEILDWFGFKEVAGVAALKRVIKGEFPTLKSSFLLKLLALFTYCFKLSS